MGTVYERRSTVTFILSLVSFLFLAAGIQAQQESDVLTNDSIVTLVKSGLSTNLIVQMIQTQPGRYSLASANVIKLKQQGVNEKVLSAMLAKSSGPKTAAGAHKLTSDQRPAAEEEPARTATPEKRGGVWAVEDVTDRMTGKTGFHAHLSQQVYPGHSDPMWDVEATCDSSLVKLRIDYFLRADKNAGFKLNVEGDGYVPGGLLGAVVMATRHQKPWTVMRVRIDGRAPSSVSSESDYSNEANILFSERSVEQVTSQMDSRSGRTVSSDEKMGQFADLFVAEKAVDTANHLFNARIVLIEFTLADGNAVILELRPQDPAFREFGSRCNVVSPVPAVSQPAGIASSPDVTPNPNVAVHARNANIPRNPAGTAPRFPGHSLDDSYQRAVEIARENQSKGVPDAMSRLTVAQWPGRPVCSSFTGNPPACVPTGEVVRLSGDLDEAADFWNESSPGYFRLHCNTSAAPWAQGQVEIKLKGQTDSNKRYVSCATAENLAFYRQTYANLGMH